MKNHFIITLILFFVMLFLPFLSLYDISQKNEEEFQSNTEPVKVKIYETDTIIEADLFSYIVGCVAAEMPASFHEEALKAQAVASYSYKKYLEENGTEIISGDAEIHQAFKTNEELKVLWGDKYEFYIEKIKNAVNSVYGEYLFDGEKTVPALYHSISPGMTENAEDVFGKDISNLTSTTAPGDKLSPSYISEKIFSEDEMKTILTKKNLNTDISSENLLKIAKKNDRNFVEKIIIADKEFSGTEARNLFGLNSPFFTVNYSDNRFIFTVYGKGHGVGMSQYSADYMARQGSSYDEILLHFYSDCSIVK